MVILFLTPNMQTTYPHILQSMGITIAHRAAKHSVRKAKGEKGKGQSLNEAKRDDDTRPESGPIRARIRPEL